MFRHKVIVDVMNSEKIIRFCYSGDMRELRQVIESKLPSWEDAFYQHVNSNKTGHIIKG